MLAPNAPRAPASATATTSTSTDRDRGRHDDGGHAPPPPKPVFSKELLLFVLALFFVWSVGVIEGVVVHILYEVGINYTDKINALEKKIEQCQASRAAPESAPVEGH